MIEKEGHSIRYELVNGKIEAGKAEMRKARIPDYPTVNR